ncbi:MAG TPA: hypothetical protein VF514_08560 [Bacteroidota bacterium]
MREHLAPGAPALFLLLFLAPSFASAQTADAPLRVHGPRVVFFGPSRAERDSIARSEGLEIDDVMDDFNYYAGKAAVFLSRATIPAEFTESRIIIVMTGAVTSRTFDRKSIEDPVGMILTDGVHEPRVVPGRGTDRDLIVQISEYFHLHEGGEQ